MTRIVAIVPIRNEEWILEKTLATLSLVCDDIIVSDQRSSDRTPEICLRYPKVRYLRNERPYPDHENRRAPLLRAARELGSSNVLLALDADEILTAQALRPEFRDFCMSLQPAEVVWLPWIMLWRDALRYRDDRSVWSGRWLPCLFRDDGASDYPRGNWHEARLPVPVAAGDRHWSGVRILHYQFVAYQRMLSKQAYCRVLERLQWPSKAAAAIDRDYAVTKDERSIRLAPVPEEWLAGWRDHGIDLTRVEDEPFSWFDREVLEAIGRGGTRAFSDLDIWDIDWSRKRGEALRRGYVTPGEVRDTRNLEERLYHWYLHRFMSPPPWRDPWVMLAPVRSILRALRIDRQRVRRFLALSRSAR